MKLNHKFYSLRPAFFTLVCAAAFFMSASFLLSAPPRAFPALRAALRMEDLPADTIGAIEGDSIAVSGPLSVEVVHGQIKTILRSGSDIRVKSSQARIDLVEGGQITICGPAHLSVLKSGGALTVALDTGTIHAHVEGAPALTVYTPQIQAKPIAIGDGPQDTLVGIDAAGAMCIRANRGAVRVEQQLTGQSVLVPQGGDVSLSNGQIEGLRPSPGRCACELLVAKAAPPAPEVGLIASTEEAHKKAIESKKTAPLSPPPAAEKSAEKQEPVYQVFMPALRFDASAKVQPEPNPQMIVLVRRVRVRPTLIYQGRVEGDPVTAQDSTANPAAKPGTQSAQQAKPSAPANDSMFHRVRTFFHNLWTPSS